MNILYSVSQSIAPYTYVQLVGHGMSFDDAHKMSSLIKRGVVSVFPSKDLPAGVTIGDNVREYL